MLRRCGAAARRVFIATGWAYFTCLFAWFAVYLATGQRFWVMELLDGVSLWLFLPVPIMLVLGVALRRRDILVGTGVAILIVAWGWGWLFLPRPPVVQAGGETLTVMTYNLYGPNLETANAVDVVRTEHPDIVMFQELNRQHGAAFRAELADEYPYQVLNPIGDVEGMGTISKYPIHDTGDRLPTNRWVGTPQILELDWNGRSITLINYHMPIPPLVPSRQGVRAADATAIAEYARGAAERGPVIAAGDNNITHLSDPYRTLTSFLTDSWGEAGYGLGHTWGGTKMGFDFPTWLVRIDYVFHTSDLHAIAARVAKFDHTSDHRGVVVTFAANPGGTR